MKRRLPSLLAGLLLASFLVGGWAAPTLHRTYHARAQYVAQQAAPSCAHGAHDAPAVERGGARAEVERCWLCARHLLGVSPLLTSRAFAPQPVTASRTSYADPYASSPGSRFVIRGPPQG